MSHEKKIESMLKMLDAKIEHIEDITADNRTVIIKLVKQSNELVKFIKQLEIEEIQDDYTDTPFLKEAEGNIDRINKVQTLKQLIDEFMTKRSELEEFEKELKKYKKEITPGQIGEA